MKMKKYEPMLAKEVEGEIAEEFLKNHFINEKIDGERGMIYYDGIAEIYNRRGIKTSHLYPELDNLKLNCKSAVLDCEVASYNDKGFSDFQRIQQRTHLTKTPEIERRAKKFPVKFMVFDILELNGKSLIDKPLSERYEILKSLKLTLPAKLTVSEIINLETWNELINNEEIKTNAEGFMFKKTDSIYKCGVRDIAWKKWKLHKFADCEILDYQKTIGDKGNEGLVLICEYKNNPIRVACGGLKDRALVEKTLKAGKQKLFAEVRFLEETNSGVMRMPTLKRIFTK